MGSASECSPDTEALVLRIARPTNDLQALLPFYRDGLGFEVLDRFEDHDGFDGMILGLPRTPYHLEFTRQRTRREGRSPSPDHLLVLYLPQRAQWHSAVDRMRRAGLEPVSSENPYWDVDGCTFEDPDGYRVVLRCAPWPSTG